MINNSKISSSSIEPKVKREQKLGTISRIVSTIFLILYLFGVPILIPKLWIFDSFENEGLAYFIITITWHEVFWLISNTFFITLYKYDFEFFRKYKVNHVEWPWKSPQKESWNSLFYSTIKVLLLNHFIMVPILLLPHLIANKSPYRIDKSFASHYEFIVQTAFFMICDDFCFYWSHRFLHIKSIYPYIHKLHHRYQNTISVAAEYAHPIEFFLGNVIPVNMGALILGRRVHLTTLLSYIAMKLYRTTEGHSGYEFPWTYNWYLPMATKPTFHNYHHLYFKGNYGALFTFWDVICNTVNKNYLVQTSVLPTDPYDKSTKTEKSE